MLQIFTAWIYISLLCWLWGYALIRVLQFALDAPGSVLLPAPVVCMAGLSVIAGVSGFLSLVIPLGGLLAQVLILVPAIVLYCFPKVRRDLRAVTGSITMPKQPAYALLFLPLLLLLGIGGASLVIHPDSVGYQIQTIRWIETYRVIPGLVHLHTQLGYQGLWYCLCAIFSFRFTGTTGITFINSTVLLWYLLFVAGKINMHLQAATNGKREQLLPALLYILLLATGYFIYGQIRLTATSVSADFIASLYVWLCFHLLLQAGPGEKASLYLCLVFFFAVVAITIKLSAAPVLLMLPFIGYRLYRLKATRAILLVLLTGLMAVTPYLARNIITSGYPLFPSTFAGTNTDWRLSTERTREEHAYIGTFARRGHNTLNNPDASSLQRWWQVRTAAEKPLLVLAVLLLLCGIAAARPIWKTAGHALRWAIVVALGGLLFWTVQAPDPRFGYGFILPFLFIVIRYFSQGVQLHPSFLRLTRVAVVLFSGLILSYAVYRVTWYFSPANLISPAGASITPFTDLRCGSVTFHVPVNCGCGNAPLPCIYYTDCSHFSMRGANITDGFRENKALH